MTACIMSNLPDLFDKEAEYRIIQAIATEPALFVNAGQLQQSDFRHIDAGAAWSRLSAMVKDGQPVFLSDFANLYVPDEVIPLPDFIRRDADTIRLLSQCRGSIQMASEIAKAAYRRDPQRIAELMRSAQDGAQASGETLQAISLGIDEALDRALNREKLEASLLKTGMDKVDNALGGGIEAQTVTMLAARPAMGKTAALVQIADHVSEQGGVVAFFQKEMSRHQIQNRLAGRRARVSLQNWRSGKLMPQEERRFADELMLLSNRETLYLDCSTPQSTEDVYALCHELKARYKRLDLVVADHVRLFNDHADNEAHRLGKISWNFKTLAKRLDTRVLLAVQLSREVERQENKRPDLKDLRDSGELEENADNVLALHRPGYYSGNQTDLTAEFITRKARDGERNYIAEMAFTKWMSFETLEKRMVDLCQ
jgi:replicative DNA helicase